MSSTDDRIVRMRFDNAQFKKDAADTQKSLADLDKATSNAGKGKGLLEMDSQMNRVSLTASKMAVITTTALATITNKVVDTGLQMANALTLEPIKAGFLEYESLLTKQNVIQNATGKSAKEVKGILNQLNTYSDRTIYSFADMTGAIQKFVNAGVPLKTSVTSIKGIANSAAFAGASSEEASRAMYAFSQSMSLGFIQLQDWNQIENANLGTVKFKESLLQAGEAAGTLTKQGKGYVTASGTFVSATKGWRDGLQDQWATTKVLNSALAKYADTNTKLGKAAFESATKVRTFTAFMDTLKESIESGWAGIFTQLIGGLDEATDFWTGLSNAVGNGVGAVFNFGITALKTWRKLGGFEKTIQGIKNILAPFGAIIHVVGAALSAAFPGGKKGVGKGLYDLSVGFELVTRPLQVLADVIEGATPVLTGFFQVIRIFGKIVSGAVGKVADFVQHILGLVHLKAPDTSGFIGFIKDIAREIGNAIKQIDELLDKGASIGQAFGSIDVKLPGLPDVPTPDVKSTAGGVSDKAQAGFAVASSTVKGLVQDVKNLGKASDETGDSKLFASVENQNYFTQFGKSVKDMLADIDTAGYEVDGFGDKISSFWDGVKKAFSVFVEKFSFEDLLASFNIAVLTTFVYNLSKFFHTLTESFEGFVGVGEGINGILENTGSALKSFQTAARAKLILNIAIALGILSAALLVLSFIPAKKLAKALAALSGTVVILALGLKVMASTIDKLDGKGINLKLIALSVAVGALGFAMLELATAFLIMNKVNFSSILKGLGTMIAVMLVMQGLGKMAEHAAKNMIAGAAAIAIVAGAMILLAGALLLFKLIKWEDIAKGGVALAGLTLAVAALALIPYAGIAKVGAALLLASLGVESMARAMLVFGLVDWSSIGKAAVALGLLTLSLAAITLLGGGAGAAGMLAIAGSVLVLAGALLLLNKVDWSSIGKLTLVMVVLIAAFAGFLAIITVFAPALIILSAFAGSLALLAVALTGLAVAFAVIFPLLAAGTGAFAAFATGAAIAFAVFVQTLAAEAPIIKKAFLDMLKVLIDGIVEAVPLIIDGIKRLWAAVKKEFTDGGKKKETGEAGKSWVQSAADGIKKKIPEITKKAIELLVTFLGALASKAASLAEAGVKVVVSLITGISRKIGDIVQAATNLIIKFATGIAQGLARIVNAGIDLIGKFLHDLADAIRRSSGVIGSGLRDVVDAMGDVGMDMVRGLIDGVQAMFGDAMGAIGDLAGGMVHKAKSILDIFSPSRVFKKIGQFLVQGLTLGIRNNAKEAIVAVASLVSGQIAVSEDLINGFLQRLDQKAIAARARAQGLAAAAKQATKAAKKTKGDEDNKAAKKLRNEARQADKAADAAEKAVRKEKAKEKRQEEYKNASLIEKAEIRSKRAQANINAAKAAEKDAEAARVQAEALERQSRAKGVTKDQRKEFRERAEKLRKQAKADAKRANKLLNQGRKNAEAAFELQQKAGAEAAKQFQEQYDAEAKADADAEAFEKLSAAEKAKKRREEADALQAKADANLAAAKEKAYTDIDAANDLAALALEQADRARDLLAEAKDYEAQGGTGQVVDLQLSDAAAVAFNNYADMYDAAYAAAAGGGGVNFTQNNYSPESLSTIDVYRQTNNLVTYAADKLTSAA